ncbi:hypothetical protein BH11PSE8_BH11PSE8_37590 [soil metagenome]
MGPVLRSSVRHRIGIAVTLVVAAVLAAGGWWAGSTPAAPSGHETSGQTTAMAPPHASDPLLSAGPPAAGRPSAPPTTHAGSKARAEPAALTPPAGVSAEQWAALQDALRNHPQREAELARISAYMAFQARQTRYRELLMSGRAGLEDARAMAASLLQELPAHVARGEVAGGEAILLQQSLFDTLASDASARVQQRLALRDAIPVPEDVQAQVALDARYKREEAALVKDWGARPAAQRDPSALADALETLRQTIFADGTAPAAAPLPASSESVTYLPASPSPTTTTKTTGGSR